jgi:hypothetical protein
MAVKMLGGRSAEEGITTTTSSGLMVLHTEEAEVMHQGVEEEEAIRGDLTVGEEATEEGHLASMETDMNRNRLELLALEWEFLHPIHCTE